MELLSLVESPVKNWEISRIMVLIINGGIIGISLDVKPNMSGH